jgi:hypothetical protein
MAEEVGEGYRGSGRSAGSGQVPTTGRLLEGLGWTSGLSRTPGWAGAGEVSGVEASGGFRFRIRHPLIPKQGEASPLLQMTNGPPGDVFEYDLHLQAIPKPDQKPLAEGVRHGPGGAEKRDALPGHPGAHVFPMVEVGGEEKGGVEPEPLKLDGIPWAGQNGPAIMAMQESEQVFRGGEIEADPETQRIGQTADPGIGPDPALLPTYYNKGAHQRQGEGQNIEFI